MPEREARFGEPIQVGERTLTPLVEVVVSAHEEPAGRVASGQVTPLGVLVDGPEGTHALGLDGRELPMAGP